MTTTKTKVLMIGCLLLWSRLLDIDRLATRLLTKGQDRRR